MPTILLFLLLLLGLGFILIAPYLVTGHAAARTRKTRMFPGRRGEVGFVMTAYCPLPVYLRFDWPLVGPLRLPPGEKTAFGAGQVELTTTAAYEPGHRGTFKTPPVTLHATDILGVFTREVPIETVQDDVLVYPQAFMTGLPELVLPLLAEGPEAQGIGVEDASRFAGVRDYTHGDPLNRMHWPSTAKYGRPMVKEFARVRATGLWVHVDTCATGGQADTYMEHVTALAASLLHAAHEEGFTFGLSAGEHHLALSRGDDHLQRAMEILARAQPEKTTRALPVPPAGINLTVLTHHADHALIDGALRARARAAQVHFVALPEGFYLRPSERGRPFFHTPDSLRRLQARRTLLEAEGVRVHLLRGNEGVWQLSKRQAG